MSEDAAGSAPPKSRGYLLDVDGVLHVGMTPVPGAAEFLDGLSARGIPYRLLTNTTTASRASLAERLRGIGLPVADGVLLTAPVATAAYIRRRSPFRPLLPPGQGGCWRRLPGGRPDPGRTRR